MTPADRARAFRAGWAVAARGALVAFGAMLAIAEGAALGVRALGSAGPSLGEALRAGGFYVAAAHRVPIRLSAAGEDLGRLAHALGGPTATTRLRAELALAPLALTALAAWLLFRAGRAVGQRVGGTAPRRALAGAAVAPLYAALVALVCLLVEVSATPLDGLRVTLAPAPLPALVLPLALGAVAGGAGGWWSTPGPDRVREVLAGGWTMLVAGLALSYAGLFLAGVVRPDGVEALLTPSTGRYFRTVYGSAATGTVVVGHHLAFSPNEAAWTLVPAMGGCTGSFPAEGPADPFLCYRRFPVEVAVPAWIEPPPSTAGPAPETRFGTAPAPYLLFLLAPAVATVLGGRRAARPALGAAAGVVFAALVVAVGWASSIWLSGSLEGAAPAGSPVALRVGPGLISGGLLGLAWGVGGGALGGALARLSRDRRTAARAPRAAPPAG